ncbi:GDSL-type esterase/lipase family protein [Zhouia spongiae]|uniref:GDSL-type esterase/lipase family protein n=1 Tax=Zhouia spongiae TaxID=2202721 RepID=A0ABY3YHT6_9FLAO|nr:GDSL-type esterase/lipase family protein [Zhouia spongiae]UNY97456.1 GDSL-type esterase/lipase family protein [Zhouia spongiae]
MRFEIIYMNMTFKKVLVGVFILFTHICGYGQKANTGPVKIACVGNSITYGMNIANRVHNSYPAQLQEMLGDDYQVENFGVSSKTLTKKGNDPYWKEEAFKRALDFKADIVFIKLGSNDAKAINRVHLDEYESDYKSLIQEFKTANPESRIVLIYPLPSFHTDTTYIWEPVIKDRLIPKIKKVAYETGIETVDMHQLFLDKSGMVPDKIHPNSLGATLIARRLYEVVKQRSIEGIKLVESLDVKNINTSNFHGYIQYNFEYRGNTVKIVCPKKPAMGRPWVWRARFFGHEPQTDIALLERGFYVVYSDVSDLYGAKEAVKRWNLFYDFLQQRGLAKKAAIEAMSRGGLIAYNWAAENPDKVACIYADAPVLDILSWPVGNGKYEGSPHDTEQLKKVYGLETNEDLLKFKGSPINKVKKVVRGKYPILHIGGEDDTVVPIDENTGPFVDAIRKSGGTVQTIYKENNGHHPHSLKNPGLIVNFILEATKQKVNLAVVPAPSGEYRSGAGWTTDADWWKQAADIDSICVNTADADILLIGNSLTQGWGGNRPHVTYKPGKQILDALFPGKKNINAGISGDRTQNVLYRLKNGTYEKCNPKYVVLTIGVNNFLDNDSAGEIAGGIERIMDMARLKFSPDTTFLLFGPLPTGTEIHSDRRIKYNTIHNHLKKLSLPDNVIYCNPIEKLTDAEGSLNMDLYSNDGIHLKTRGYKVWGTFIKNIIANIEVK